MAWYWPFSFPPKLDWLQVEISSYCTAACLYCPRTIYEDKWQNRHMDEALFRRLLPVFRKTRMVHLQGWGEPFTHPRFFDFVRLAKDAGCLVGTTTNGMLLDEGKCERLVAEDVAIVGFSLAGTGADNDQVRRGTRLAKVLSVIETIHRIKQRTGAERPAVHIAYLLLRSGLRDIHHLVDLLKGRGIAQVVISTLDFVGSPSLMREAISPEIVQDDPTIRRQLEAVVQAGQDAGLPIHFRLPALSGERQASKGYSETESLLVPAAPRLCTENIQHAAFIGVTGTVSPCVYTNLPVSGVHHIVDHEERPFHPTVLGLIQEQSFATIWRSTAYSAFRKAHQSGAPPPSCLSCTRNRDTQNL